MPQLKDLSSEELNNTLRSLGESLGFHWIGQDLEGIRTFGELCDRVFAKLEGRPTQAYLQRHLFYTLRRSFAPELKKKPDELLPETLLNDLFATAEQRNAIRKVEKQTGLKILPLLFPQWFNVAVLLLLVFGLAAYLGVDLILISALFIGSLLLISNLAKRKVNTFGDLSRELARRQYRKTRREEQVYAPEEVATLIRSVLADQLDLEEKSLRKDAKLPASID